MTRFLITDPDAAAHSAKNVHAAPGLPNQPENRSGRTLMVGTDTSPEESGNTLAQRQAEGLRALAAMIEQYPALAATLDFPLRQMHGYLVSREEDPRGTLHAFHAAASTCGAAVRVANDPDRCRVQARFGPVVLELSAHADVMAGQQRSFVEYSPLEVDQPGGGER
jgi:hypothetical protein